MKCFIIIIIIIIIELHVHDELLEKYLRKKMIMKKKHKTNDVTFSMLFSIVIHYENTPIQIY